MDFFLFLHFAKEKKKNAKLKFTEIPISHNFSRCIHFDSNETKKNANENGKKKNHIRSTLLNHSSITVECNFSSFTWFFPLPSSPNWFILFKMIYFHLGFHCMKFIFFFSFTVCSVIRSICIHFIWFHFNRLTNVAAIGRRHHCLFSLCMLTKHSSTNLEHNKKIYCNRQTAFSCIASFRFHASAFVPRFRHISRRVSLVLC